MSAEQDPLITYKAEDPQQTKETRTIELDWFDGCPECAKNTVLNVGRDHYGCCDTHMVYWEIGSNLFSTWRTQTDAEWQKNRDLLLRCIHVDELDPRVRGFIAVKKIRLPADPWSALDVVTSWLDTADLGEKHDRLAVSALLAAFAGSDSKHMAAVTRFVEKLEGRRNFREEIETNGLPF